MKPKASVYQITEWCVGGRKSRRRPRAKWRDKVENDLEGAGLLVSWKPLATDRLKWRLTEERLWKR